MGILLRTVDLHKSYHSGPVELAVLRGVDIAVGAGEIISIVGASGVGKSTLLNLMGALDRPTFGTVLYDLGSPSTRNIGVGSPSQALESPLTRGSEQRVKTGASAPIPPEPPLEKGGTAVARGSEQDIFKLTNRELTRFRNRELGFIFQFHHLLPEFSAIENVMMPALIAGKKKEEARKLAADFLKSVGLEERARHRPGELSGGEQQRVAVARALVNDPRVVLADEPTGNLDRKTSEEVHDLLWELNGRMNQTFVIATHNENLARRSDRVIRLADGQAEEVGI